MASIGQSAVLETGRLQEPYVGPRTFSSDEAHLFFGREREARDLTALIVAERLVLFYAQSGAGKSSLLNTRVKPNLEKEGFEVLPIGRVSGVGGDEVSAENIFVYNLIAGLQEGQDRTSTLQTLTLSEFLDNLVHTASGEFLYKPAHKYRDDELLKPRVLIIDQFEEVFTTNVAFWPMRAEFFAQLGTALRRDELLWVVLTLREDFIAGLDSYLHHLPNRLQKRFYLRRLERAAALKAIVAPANLAGKTFAPGAAELLVENLQTIRTDKATQKQELGQFIEPVQLQAVCKQMWGRLRDRPDDVISMEDVRRFADVDRALKDFYEDTIAAVVSESDIFEYELRNWFETQLITEAKTRSLIYRGDTETGNLSTAIADKVKASFLLREVVRPGGIWYELPHDRFVDVILKANREWTENLPYLKLAETWDDAGRPDSMLVEGGQLDQLLESEWEKLGPDLADFVKKSLAFKERKAAEAKARDQARQTQILQRALIIVAVFLAVAIIATINAINQSQVATAEQENAMQEAERAATAEAEAILEADRAANAAAVAATAESEAVANAERAAVEAESAFAEASIARATAESAAFELVTLRQTLTPVVQETPDVSFQSVLLAEHTDQINAIAFAPDNSILASASADGTVRLWDLEAEEFSSEIYLVSGTGFSLVSFSPDGARIAAVGGDRNIRVCGFDCDIEFPPTLSGHEAQVLSIAFDPSGTLLASGSLDRTVRLWSVDEPSAEPIVLVGHEDWVRSVAFSPDGDLLVSGSDDGTARLWNIFGEELAVLAGHFGGILAASFSPDGALILTASSDGTARLWDTTGLVVAVLEGHSAGIASASFSPDGTQIVTASSDGTARLWDTTGLVVAVLEGHSAGIVSASFSPDGTQIVTASSDGTARLWDASGALVAILEGHEAPVTSAIFDLSGQWLATSSLDGTIRLWNLQN